jgi:8-amino-7-oxononanoate synthase
VTSETESVVPPLPSDLLIESAYENYGPVDEGDIFSKVQGFTMADRARELGLYPFFQVIDNNDGPEAQIDGQRVLMFGSSNYLGLTRHPEVVDAARAAILKYGTSTTGSRLVSGTTRLHEELESRIAQFLHTEAALTFSSGYHASLGILSTLADKRSVLVLDKLDDASIYDGAQLADGEMVRFRHNDASHLDSVLSRVDKTPFVIVSGVYSMRGVIAALPAIVEVCERHKARLMIDDSDGVGVIGVGGRGTASHFGLEGHADLIMGTLSKSLASNGGFVAGPAKVLEWIKTFSRSMLFSASLSPASAAAALMSLDVLERQPEIVSTLQRNGERWREGLKSLGYATLGSDTPIVSVDVGDEYQTVMFRNQLLAEGVYTVPAIYPAVNMKEAILWTCCIASHTRDQIDEALQTFRSVGRKMGIIEG